MAIYLKFLLYLSAAVGLGGCVEFPSTADTDQVDAPEGSSVLSDLTLQPGFRIETNKTAKLTIQSLRALQGVVLSVRTPEGEVLFTGSAEYAAQRPMSLRVPGTTQFLALEFNGPELQRQARVQLSAGQEQEARYELR